MHSLFSCFIWAAYSGTDATRCTADHGGEAKTRLIFPRQWIGRGWMRLSPKEIVNAVYGNSRCFRLPHATGSLEGQPSSRQERIPGIQMATCERQRLAHWKPVAFPRILIWQRFQTALHRGCSHVAALLFGLRFCMLSTSLGTLQLQGAQQGTDTPLQSRDHAGDTNAWRMRRATRVWGGRSWALTPPWSHVPAWSPLAEI